MPRALFFVVCSLTYKEVCLLSDLTGRIGWTSLTCVYA